MGNTKFPNGLETSAITVDGAVTSDNDGILYGEIVDISTGASSWTAALPYAVEITGAYVTQTAATSGSSALITFEIAGTAITTMVATVTTAGAAGLAYAAVAPTAANALAAGISIEIITNGGSSTASKGIVGITYKRV
jgi:hypothetical protein